MDWEKIEVAELDAYTPWVIIIAPVLGMIAALLVADGWAKNELGTLIVGGGFGLALGALLLLRYLGPVPTEFLEVIASADWCPDAMDKLKELIIQYEGSFSLRHFRIVEKIQRRRDWELSAKKDRASRDSALDCIRSRR